MEDWQKQQKKAGRAVKVILVVFGLMFAVTVIINRIEMASDEGVQERSAPSRPSYVSEDNSTMAYIMIQDFVKDRLKSPSTAEFPGARERRQHTKRLGDGRYGINSWVESQNSFGAQIRTRFAAIIRQTGEDTWQLEQLAFDE